MHNRFIRSYYRTSHYRGSNRQSFRNFIPFALQENREPSILYHSRSSSQENYTSNIQSLQTHTKVLKQGQSSKQGKIAARAGETTTKTILVQASVMTSTISLFPLPHQLEAPYFDVINITEYLAHWEDLTMDCNDGHHIKKMLLYCETTLGL